MRTNLEQQISQAKSLLDVLLILKQVTMLDTHVATLVYLDSLIKPFDGRAGVWACKPFPLSEGQGEYLIHSYYFSAEGDSFSEGAMALVVFCDMNFISGLQTPGPTPTETKDQVLHSLKYGVIVSLPGLSLTAKEKEEILDI